MSEQIDTEIPWYEIEIPKMDLRPIGTSYLVKQPSADYLQGWRECEERIIKLIEEENKYLYELEIEYVIELIRGEHK